jgi:hypothetical protein
MRNGSYTMIGRFYSEIRIAKEVCHGAAGMYFRGK